MSEDEFTNFCGMGANHQCTEWKRRGFWAATSRVLNRLFQNLLQLIGGKDFLGCFGKFYGPGMVVLTENAV